ncbi:MAG: hypothetical protein ACOYL8_02845 [Patescibacteria group bacterium]
MKAKLTELIKTLLNIHKALLDLEKASYEAKNGSISNNQEYFNLVINHEDFKWLRVLSEVIALIDEESEQEPIATKKVQELLVNLKNLLEENNDNEFSLRYYNSLNSHKNIFDLNNEIVSEIENILNN